jgi:hypothetical protein
VDRIVWYTPVADEDIFDQVNFRIRRISQEHKQCIAYCGVQACDWLASSRKCADAEKVSSRLLSKDCFLERGPISPA